MMKRITAILFALVLIFSVALLPASAAGEPASYSYRFDDNADLLTDAEEQALKETLYDVCSKCGCNIVFFTANDLNGATFSHTGTAQDYTQRYYETCCGVNTDGVVCGLVLRDEDGDRQVLLYGSGKCVKRLSDSESKDIRDNAISKHNPDSKGYYDFLNSIALGVKDAVPPHLKWYMLPLALLIGFAIAMIIMSIFKKQLKSVKMERGAVNYVRQGSMNVTASRDTYLYSTVSRTARPKESSSSGSSHSSGGGSYSGGGSKF